MRNVKCYVVLCALCIMLNNWILYFSNNNSRNYHCKRSNHPIKKIEILIYNDTSGSCNFSFGIYTTFLRLNVHRNSNLLQFDLKLKKYTCVLLENMYGEHFISAKNTLIWKYIFLRVTKWRIEHTFLFLIV